MSAANKKAAWFCGKETNVVTREDGSVAHAPMCFATKNFQLQDPTGSCVPAAKGPNCISQGSVFIPANLLTSEAAAGFRDMRFVNGADAETFRDLVQKMRNEGIPTVYSGTQEMQYQAHFEAARERTREYLDKHKKTREPRFAINGVVNPSWDQSLTQTDRAALDAFNNNPRYAAGRPARYRPYPSARGAQPAVHWVPSPDGTSRGTWQLNAGGDVSA